MNYKKALIRIINIVDWETPTFSLCPSDIGMTDSNNCNTDCNRCWIDARNKLENMED